ncbi:hypothetical protein I3842_06G052500 [Carya illinoinensis]|uniref:BED-type domain-containing protein n=1 Tax=Carya illinoinensis TaxID=32201 RepID=A0A922ES55_CARIL|nr:hypothetical protein I3842_06G052500 [Carya illinoinensis]
MDSSTSTNDVQESIQSSDMPPPPPSFNVSDKSNIGGSQSGRIRSMVWDHFTIIPKGDPTKPMTACNYCGVSYACDTKINGTKSMKHHIEKQCKKDNSRLEGGGR